MKELNVNPFDSKDEAHGVPDVYFMIVKSVKQAFLDEQLENAQQMGISYEIPNLDKIDKMLSQFDSKQQKSVDSDQHKALKI